MTLLWNGEIPRVQFRYSVVGCHIELYGNDRCVAVLQGPHVGVFTAVTQLKYARKPIVAAVGRILSLVKLLCPFCIRLPAYFDAFQVVSLAKINIPQCALSHTSGQRLYSDASYIRTGDRKVGIYLQVVIG